MPKVVDRLRILPMVAHRAGSLGPVSTAVERVSLRRSGQGRARSRIARLGTTRMEKLTSEQLDQSV